MVAAVAMVAVVVLAVAVVAVAASPSKARSEYRLRWLKVLLQGELTSMREAENETEAGEEIEFPTDQTTPTRAKDSKVHGAGPGGDSGSVGDNVGAASAAAAQSPSAAVARGGGPVFLSPTRSMPSSGGRRMPRGSAVSFAEFSRQSRTQNSSFSDI